MKIPREVEKFMAYGFFQDPEIQIKEDLKTSGDLRPVEGLLTDCL